jgi:transposase
VVDHYARKTKRLLEVQQKFSLSTGGEVGARLASLLSFPASPDTLLRMIRSFPEGPMNNPLYLGVDDWAFRKRLKYGTILVDLATHKPIELLPDRETKTLANWLRNHPGILVISRDRSSAYIEAINQGAPDSIQVADRWHLLHNLVETIERVLTRRYKEVKSANKSLLLNEESSPELETEVGQDQSEDRNPLQPSSQYDRRKQQVREKHQVQFDEIRELHRQGAGIREISRRLHVSREKVRKYLQNDTPPEYRRKKMATILDPYWEHIQDRWANGSRNAMELWLEIREMGYPGCYMSLAREVRSLRRVMPRKTKHAKQKKQIQKTSQPEALPLSPRQTAWVFVRKKEELSERQVSLLDSLLAISEDFQRLYKLAQQFWSIIGERKKEQLREWMISATESGIIELRNFVKSLQKDLAAVEASLTYEWSNGPVEGQNNRLKMIKRQMYGRANFDLLRLRVLYS